MESPLDDEQVFPGADPKLLRFLRTAAGEGEVEGDDMSAEEEQEAEESEVTEGEEEQHASAPPIAFANAMAKVLAQPVRSRLPILASRRTAIMRAMDDAKAKEHAHKDSVQHQRELRERFRAVPDRNDVALIVRERKLRKIATRGVVAMFNAIRAAQKTARSEGQDELRVTAKAKHDEVKDKMQQSFLDMLRRAASGKAADAGSVVSAATTASGASGGSASATKRKAPAKSEDGSSTWAVLDDNLMLGASMKQWHRDEAVVQAAKRRKGFKGEVARKAAAADVFTADQVDDGDEAIDWSD
mmetsp:Transcript_30902/g.100720  ORF Transcript_30902/g.100720 Transcript_30902/m.100720 type:complete len:300 (+) Transcript_30902:1-900(+)